MVPDRDIDGKVVGFVLSLKEPNRSDESPAYHNLLDPTLRLHGYQRWTFGAHDYAHGAERSVYGAVRTMSVPRLGIEVRAEVARVAVAPTPAALGSPAGYRFTQLTLRVLVRKKTPII